MKNAAFASATVVLATLLVTAPASAGPQTNAGSASTGLGGGLIEFLLTQRQPPQQQRAVRQQLRAAPESVRGYWSNTGFQLSEEPQAEPDFVRPRGNPAAPSRQAALSQPGVEKELDPVYRKQLVDYAGKHGAGTIVIDTPNKFLYLVQGDGKALRYGIGVGRPGFTWAGEKTVTRKAEWPGWTPPPEMLKRRPDLPRHMEGGPANPLGARAMYLGSTLYRIHGTNEPDTIGTNVSSGCIRMLNADVVDLYERVKVGTKVIVM